MRLNRLLPALLLALSAWTAQANESSTPRPATPSRTTIAQEQNGAVTHITITAQDGSVSRADVLVALGQVQGFNLNSIRYLLPSGNFDLQRKRTWLTLQSMNWALDPCLECTIVHPKTRRAEPALVMKIDHAALLARERRAKSKIRTVSLRMLNYTGVRQERRYGIDLDDKAAQTPGNLVILVHGYNSGPEEVAGLLDGARSAGLGCGIFRYPNDQAIVDSAALLSRELAALKRQHPARGVSLLAYSMGGLVAREMIENQKLDPGNVRQLIMIAPPNHGTVFARLACGMDLREHLCQEERGCWDALYAGIEDGLGEAEEDLQCGSLFLRQLNARPRNSKVRYTIFLGNGGQWKPEQVARFQNCISSACERSIFKPFEPKLRSLSEQLGEATEEGDGVIAVRRGRLEGVDDIVVLKFTHWDVTDNAAQDDIAEVHRQILQRLQNVDR